MQSFNVDAILLKNMNSKLHVYSAHFFFFVHCNFLVNIPSDLFFCRRHVLSHVNWIYIFCFVPFDISVTKYFLYFGRTIFSVCSHLLSLCSSTMLLAVMKSTSRENGRKKKHIMWRVFWGFYTNPTDYSEHFSINLFFFSSLAWTLWRMLTASSFMLKKEEKKNLNTDPIRIITEKIICKVSVWPWFHTVFQFDAIIISIYIYNLLYVCYRLPSNTHTSSVAIVNKQHFNIMLYIIVLNHLCVCIETVSHERNL